MDDANPLREQETASRLAEFVWMRVPRTRRLLMAGGLTIWIWLVLAGLAWALSRGGDAIAAIVICSVGAGLVPVVFFAMALWPEWVTR